MSIHEELRGDPEKGNRDRGQGRDTKDRDITLPSVQYHKPSCHNNFIISFYVFLPTPLPSQLYIPF